MTNLDVRLHAQVQRVQPARIGAGDAEAEAPERQISDNDRKATNQFFLELVDT